MQSNAEEIVLQLPELLLEQQRILCELARNDLLLIESARGSASSESLLVAAATVRATLYSVDGLADRLRAIAARLQR